MTAYSNNTNGCVFSVQHLPHLKIIAFPNNNNGRFSVFIICHSVKWLPNIWELKQVGKTEYEEMDWPQWIGQ